MYCLEGFLNVPVLKDKVVPIKGRSWLIFPLIFKILSLEKAINILFVRLKGTRGFKELWHSISLARVQKNKGFGLEIWKFQIVAFLRMITDWSSIRAFLYDLRLSSQAKQNYSNLEKRYHLSSPLKDIMRQLVRLSPCFFPTFQSADMWQSTWQVMVGLLMVPLEFCTAFLPIWWTYAELLTVCELKWSAVTKLNEF